MPHAQSISRRPLRPSRASARLTVRAAPDRSVGSRDTLFRRSTANNSPDDEAEHDGHGHKSPAEQKQRSIEDRLRIHARIEQQRHAAQPFLERLLPDDDVAAIDAVPIVLIPDPAWQVEAECHDLPSGPADVADVLACRRADRLLVLEEVTVTLELVL